jgi:hypothetical protein
MAEEDTGSEVYRRRMYRVQSTGASSTFPEMQDGTN